MNFNPQNILIINFGQLGDVILSLPAFFAIREKFADAKITALIGKASAEIIELAGFADEKIAVDRVKLRDSGKLWSINEIFKLSKEIRRRKFDFVIDLHSLSETNLLGFFSGAKHRLYINRESRSLDFLGNFEPKPPLEDKTKHATDRYLDVLKSLSIKNPKRFAQILPPPAAIENIENLWREKNIADKQTVGLFPGAGHPSRRWKLEYFAELARRFGRLENIRTIVFLGPEEKDLRGEVEKSFPAETVIVDKLTIPQLAAAMARLRVLISNDTGAMHVGALVGTPIVLLLDERAPTNYLPLTEKIRVISNGTLDEISVGEVFQAAQNYLQFLK
ncbi:MAG: glycosyltransferase family 9 protein [Acidobacteriota bacterium]